MKITFHLKSGAALEVVADDISIKHINNELSAYTLTGMKRTLDLFYVRIEEIVAITTKA